MKGTFGKSVGGAMVPSTPSIFASLRALFTAARCGEVRIVRTAQKLLYMLPGISSQGSGYDRPDEAAGYFHSPLRRG
jgi:hypothetical protein